jgi:hypothetical protein
VEYVDTILAFAVAMVLLSLVTTTLVQIVVYLTELRGKNLLWGVTKVLERSPKLRERAKEISKAVLQHPAVTATARYATAIGSDELVAVLHDLSRADSKVLAEDVKNNLGNLLEEKAPPQTKEVLNTLSIEFNRLFPEEASKMAAALTLVRNQASELRREIDTWFETIMNRTTDRFIVHTRQWTVFFAVALSVGLQVDALDLIKTLSTDAELRSALARSATETVSRADQVLSQEPVAVAAIKTIQVEFGDLIPKDIPTTLVTRNEGAAWLQNALEGKSQASEVQERYRKEFEKLTPEKLGRLGNQVLELRGELEESRLVLVPATWSAYKKRWAEIDGHLTGILMSALLLSLGAPFWYNALKTLSSLKPILAGTPDPSKLKER